MIIIIIIISSRCPLALQVPAAFGYKQPLHSAFMGGGIVTALFINVQHAVGIGWSAAICALV